MMLTERLYVKSPVVVQNAMVTAYGLLLSWRRLGGKRHREIMKEIAAAEKLDQAEVHALQGNRLRDLLVHAGQAVPYYRETFRRLGLDPQKDDPFSLLQALPILEKDKVREGAKDFRSDGESKAYVINTSGTTGSPLAVHCDRRALLANHAHFYHLRRRLGVGRRDRCATFAGRTIVERDRSRPPFWRHNLAANTILYSTYHMSPSNMDAYLERLAEQRPILVDSYPSALGVVADALLRRSDLAIRPQGIITSSETLLPHQRSAAEAAFGCRVTDQYGNAEMSAFVAQCERGTYHVWPTYGVCEVLVDGRPARPGETGELITTGFINHAMPLVRYRTGDMAVAGSGCACALSFPTIERIRGRVDDMLVTPDGRQVGRLDPVFKGLPDDAFREVQIVQVALDQVVLRYVPGSRFDELAVGKVKLELEKRLGPRVRVAEERATRLPRSANGKLRAVVGLRADGSAKLPDTNGADTIP